MKKIILFVGVYLIAINGLTQSLQEFKDQYGSYGYKNSTGKVVVKPQYKYAYKFVDGLAVVCTDKCGCINEKGKVIIPLIYDHPAYPDRFFSNGLVSFSLNWKFGFLDKTGKEIIPFKYKWVKNFNEDIAEVSEGYVSYTEARYFIDKTGKKLFSTSDYSVVLGFNNGLCRVERYVDKKLQAGFIDKTGREVIPVKYESITFQDDGYIQVTEKGKYGWYNKNYELFIPPKYEYGGGGSGVFKPVKEDGKYGCLNEKYELFIPTLYNSPVAFSEGMGALNLNGLWGFANTTGEITIPFQYEKLVEGFKNGTATMEHSGERFSIDKTGKRIEGTTTIVKQAPVRELMTDVDGKKYFVVTIGKQTWMASDLTVTHFRNGDPIDIVTDHTTWRNTKKGAASFYDNDKDLSWGTVLLYNMYTINDPRSICPTGWHIPAFEESEILQGTIDQSFNMTYTGYRGQEGLFKDWGSSGYFWAINKVSQTNTKVFAWGKDSGLALMTVNSPTYGFPIRCIKD